MWGSIRKKVKKFQSEVSGENENRSEDPSLHPDSLTLLLAPTLIPEFIVSETRPQSLSWPIHPKHQSQNYPMHRSLKFIAVPALLLLGPAACATQETAASASPGQKRPEKETTPQTEAEPQISIGMTKAQVLKAWGEPSGKDVTGHGEIWVYGNSRMLRMIPYAGPFLNVNTSKVLFGPNGRVQDFRNTNSGNAWSQSEGMGGSGFSRW